MPLRAAIGIVIMGVLLSLIRCAANAAVVMLKNGDRVTGHVVKIENKTT